MDGPGLERAFRRGQGATRQALLYMTAPPWFGVMWEHNLATEETKIRIFVPKKGDTTTIHFVYATDELDAYMKLRDVVEGKLNPDDYLLTVPKLRV